MKSTQDTAPETMLLQKIVPPGQEEADWSEFLRIMGENIGNPELNMDWIKLQLVMQGLLVKEDTLCGYAELYRVSAQETHQSLACYLSVSHGRRLFFPDQESAFKFMKSYFALCKTNGITNEVLACDRLDIERKLYTSADMSVQTRLF